MECDMVNYFWVNDCPSIRMSVLWAQQTSLMTYWSQWTLLMKLTFRDFQDLILAFSVSIVWVSDDSIHKSYICIIARILRRSEAWRGPGCIFECLNILVCSSVESMNCNQGHLPCIMQWRVSDTKKKKPCCNRHFILHKISNNKCSPWFSLLHANLLETL